MSNGLVRRQRGSVLVERLEGRRLLSATPASPPAGSTKLTGSVIGTGGSWNNEGNTAAKVFDGNLSTYFDAPVGNGAWAGLDLGSAARVTQVQFAARAGYESRMAGGVFQASTTANFSANVVTLYTVPGSVPSNGYTTVSVGSAGAFEYVRYLSPNNGYGNVAEVEFDGVPTTTTGGGGGGVAQLTGTTYGTPGSWNNEGNTIYNATDGNTNTYFDSPTDSGNVGIDLGSARTVTQIRFAPRPGYGSRMVAGLFQYSTAYDFSSNVTTVYEITAVPADGLNTVNISAPAERYWRYIGPNNGYGNIAEFQLFGPASPTPTWTGTDADIGSPGRAGSASSANGTVTVTGGGADIWDQTDQFNFDYQSLAGNGTVVARVASQGNTDGWAKAGVMVRESANADSRFVLLALTPGNGVTFQARSATHTTPASSSWAGSTGVWLKITRNGSTFTGYTSADGVNWSSVGQATIPMVNNVLAGLAVTAHDNGQASTATFTNVAVTATGGTASIWTAGATAPMPRWESETFTYNNRLYVFGGFVDRNLDATAECDVYDPAANRWSYVTTVPTGALTHAAVAVVGNVAYFAGGDVGTFTYGRTATSTARVLTYNLASGAWGTTASLPADTSCGGMVAVNNHLYYYGGLNANDSADVNNTWGLDLSNPGAGWKALAPMPDARDHLGAVTINGIAYAVGGNHNRYDEVNGNDNQIDAYNPATDTWTALASLPMPWSSNETTTLVANGKVVLVGGQTNGGYDGIYLNLVEEYDPASNRWSQVGTLPEANEGESAAYINGQLVVAQGTVDNLGGWSQNQVWVTSGLSV